jgi:hypothetical protein
MLFFYRDACPGISLHLCEVDKHCPFELSDRFGCVGPYCHELKIRSCLFCFVSQIIGGTYDLAQLSPGFQFRVCSCKIRGGRGSTGARVFCFFGLLLLVTNLPLLHAYLARSTYVRTVAAWSSTAKPAATGPPPQGRLCKNNGICAYIYKTIYT